ncbi:MAG: pyridoxal 5'-phosphate synthase glutaminase subunit PdxT [archaeon]
MVVGVLAFQGAVSEHISMLRACGVPGIEVRSVGDLKSVDRLIIPGGESTTMGKLLSRFKLDSAIIDRVLKGMPVFGTCAGLILLAKNIQGSKQKRLGLLDVTIKRNDYGRQVDSFEEEIAVRDFDAPFPAVFIRAPVIKSARCVEVLARLDTPVFVRQGNILGSTFHPELTKDIRIHKYFIGL